jgi:hypothetical protein
MLVFQSSPGSLDIPSFCTALMTIQPKESPATPSLNGLSRNNVRLVGWYRSQSENLSFVYAVVSRGPRLDNGHGVDVVLSKSRMRTSTRRYLPSCANLPHSRRVSDMNFDFWNCVAEFHEVPCLLT